MVIPLVLTFVGVLLLFAFAMMRSRVETKFESLVTFHYQKAHLMAQSGIQHAMMKIRLCPDEAFEAAARQFGICPLNDNAGSGSGGGNRDLMQTFISDMKCDDLGVAGTSGWGYRVVDIVTKAAKRQDNRLVTVVEIEAEGWAIEGRGSLDKRTEVVKKTVSIVKSN
jgi:hypothetical protein